LRSLRLWAGFLVALLAIDALVSVGAWLLFSVSMDRIETAASPAPSDLSDLFDLAQALQAASWLNLAAAVVLWCVWQWNAAANVRDRVRLAEPAAPPLRFTPGWSVAWWFVPLLNLWQPLRATTELWDRSHAIDGSWRPRHWLLWSWWVILLSPLLLIPAAKLYSDWALQRLMEGHEGPSRAMMGVWDHVLLANTMKSVALDAFAVVVVLTVTGAQAELPPIDEDAVPA
jgi:hypothetical protein